MQKVFSKVDRYFKRYEFGVYREAKGDDDNGAVWAVKPTADIENYLKAMNASGKHIFIRPTFEREPHYMMCDDHSKQELDTFHKENGKWKPGRLVVETSPGNYQVWVKSNRPLNNEEKSYWLKKMGSDPGASPKHRWGRAPGFRNKKDKYLTEDGHPLAKLVWVDWKGSVEVPRVEMPTLEQKEISQPKKRLTAGKHHSLPVRADFERGDNNATDFAYALSLLRRGVDRNEVQDRILSERDNWDNHRSESARRDYFKRTLDKAEAMIKNTPAAPRHVGRQNRGAKSERESPEPEYHQQNLNQGLRI